MKNYLCNFTEKHFILISGIEKRFCGSLIYNDLWPNLSSFLGPRKKALMTHLDGAEEEEEEENDDDAIRGGTDDEFRH